ncbi:MAG: hypothetical protein MSC51_04015 [Mollicutes bacterium]|nr:hypothetical protein [Mollicutes bacterium]
MTKIINVNPRYKALKTGATPRKFYFNKTTKLPEELITKIFGISSYKVIKNSQSRESLEKDLDIFLDNWYNILSENLNEYNDKVIKAYSDVDKQQKIIQLLQRYSNNNLDRN